jgi:protein-disulfide isomerase
MDRAAFAELKRISGQTYTPTLVIGNLVLPDFGSDELEDFLKQHNILP